MAVPHQWGREVPVVLYEYRPTRKAENAAAFLESFSGWLHADGYAGYHRRLPKNIRVVGCWAYLRRKFDEAYITNFCTMIWATASAEA